jgi:hypothetical protein
MGQKTKITVSIRYRRTLVFKWSLGTRGVRKFFGFILASAIATAVRIWLSG